MSLHSLQTDELPERAAYGRRPDADMVCIPGGTFRMGSDHHYPEEAPAHRVTVDWFWMDGHRSPTGSSRRLSTTTGHVTFAEIPPDPKDYPGALPHMIYAGSLVFSPPVHQVDLRDWRRVVDASQGRGLASSLRPGERYRRAGRSSGRACGVCRRAGLRHMGRQGLADRSRVGVCRARRTRLAPSSHGAMNSRPAASIWRTPGRVNFRGRTFARTVSSAPRRSPLSRRMATACTT